MAATARDIEAAGRLYSEVLRAYAGTGTKVRNDRQLHMDTGIARGTLDGYFKDGVMPDPGNLRLIAEKLGLDYTRLWCRWLDVPLPDDSLVRIADALDRAFPKPANDPADEDEDVAGRTLEAARALRDPAG